ncbi:hypothetical protein F4553_000436 [Allocatelliglobosispora scoriae]|uniref:Condensation domain-containing protein n=1 Tax=Allocatelliglobosispora scoriae TaxID=643052 RepID=A0A841BD71_9ACTN|nr:condensation domain-containing protein [Allocatelliglobosispora scoriae]MBB5867057.1 hypothetical protein [Allocatelliglobosispora scoriae]
MIPALDPSPVATFHGGRSVTARLTWGQQGIWNIITAMAPHDAFLNQRRIVAVPAGAVATLAAVAAAVGTLISRHESLRTRIRTVGQVPWQDVAAAGECPIEVLETAPDQARRAAKQARERLRLIPFDYAEDLPIRVTAVLADGTVRYLVLVLAHIAVDWYALARLERELTALLVDGAVAAAPGRQPADMAEREHSAAGRQRTRRVQDYWRGRYTRFPAQAFPPAAPSADPYYGQADLVSPALGTTCQMAASRYGTSSSAVLLAATCAVLAAWTRQDRLGMLTLVNNRFHDGHRDVIAPVNQLGILAFDLSGTATFGDLVTSAWRESLSCFRHAYYDQDALDGFLEDTGRLHDGRIAPFCCFNDMRAANGHLRGRRTGTARLHAARRRSRITWREPLRDFSWHFMLSVSDLPGSLCVSLAADARYLPPRRQVAVLLAFEELVVTAATREVRLAELYRGVERARKQRWPEE